MSKTRNKGGAALDRRISAAYHATCAGIQINMLDIPKVFAHARGLLAAAALTDDELGAGVRAYVETIRQN